MFGSTWGPASWFWGGWFWGGVDVDLWDIFEQFFGWNSGASWFGWQSRSRSTEMRWENIEEILEVDLKTSIYWGKEKIKISKMVTCSDCNGKWWESKKTCPDCHGTWQVTYTQQSIFWVIQQRAACEKCSATWEVFEKVCEKCNGQKRTREIKEIDLDIPAGIDNWMVIKLEWEWNDWIWTSATWDLYIKFRVKTEEKWLKRKWVDLHYEIEVDVVEAILGTKKSITIPVIWKRNIEIPNWTQPWTILKISGDWVKYIDKDSKGDLYITINVKISKKLSKKEKELYLEIAKEKKINVNNHKWIFEKLFG
jgi:molecular chaperone DnaJ